MALCAPQASTGGAVTNAARLTTRLKGHLDMTPTELTLRKLRTEGYLCEKTEHWNNFAKIRVDLFGFVDILAVGNGETVGVQTTSYSNVSARVAKIRDSEKLPRLLEAGWRVVVHGWRKDKQGRWIARIVDIGSDG